MAMKRLNWLKWLRPGHVELQTEQLYWNDKRRRHMSKEHSVGIVEGLGVTEGSTALHVDVAAGRAIAPDGNDIVIESVQDIDLSSYAAAGGLAYIVAEFSETLTDPYYVEEIGTSQSKYYQETPTVSHQSGAPTGNQVEIARVQVSVSATDITAAADPLDPQDDEINLLNRKISQVAMSDEALGYKVLDPSGDSVLEQMALLGCQDGDRFWLPAGTYDLGPSASAFTIPQDGVRLEGTRSTVIQLSGGSVQLDGTDCSLMGFTVDFDGSAAPASGVILDGSGDHRLLSLEFTRTGTAYGRAVEVSGSSVRDVIRDCVFAGTGAVGLYVSSTTVTDLIIDHCTFTTSTTLTADAYCISTSAGNNGPGTIVRGCTFNLTAPPGSEDRFGIQLGDDWITDSCEFVGPVTHTDQYGVKVIAGTDGWAIRECTFYDLHEGVTLTGVVVNHTLIENCEFTNISNGIYFDCSGASNNNRALNNTFVGVTNNSIYYANQTDLQVVGNSFYIPSNSFAAISLSNVVRFNVDENRAYIVSTSVAQGILISGACSNGTVNDNVMIITSGVAVCTGIYVVADKTVISGNRVKALSTAGSTVGQYVVGIRFDGDQLTITDNVIDIGGENTTEDPGVYGIVAISPGASCDNINIDGNVLESLGGAATIWGITLPSAGARYGILNNQVWEGFTSGQSIDCNSRTGILDGNQSNGTIANVGSMTAGTNRTT